MSNVKIGYECLADRAGVTLSSVQAAATNVVDNAFDRLEFDFWQIDAADVAPAVQLQHASAQACDYVMFLGHDLDPATDEFRVRYSADGATWYDAQAWTAVVDGVNFRSFTAQSDLYFLIEFRRDAGVTAFAPVVSIISIGSVLDVGRAAQVGFRPPLANGFMTNAATSVGGQFLGRSIREQAGQIDLKFPHLTPAWIRANWVPFIEHAKAKPFAVSWDEANYPAEAAWCWTEKEADIVDPNYSTGIHMDAAIKCRAKV